MKLRALLVEDDPDQLDGLELVFDSIPEAERQRYGIDEISVEKADCTQLAREKLESAARSARPYDILLQDLNLPSNPGGKEEGVEVGHSLLEFAHGLEAAKEICVVSVNTDFNSVSAAFRRGAVDFISKPYEPTELPRRILQLWERRLMKESAKVFEDRIKILIPYAEREFISQISSCLSNVVHGIRQEVEGMKRSFSERFGLDTQSDSQDPLLEHLAVMRQTVSEAMKEWGETKELAQDIFNGFLPLTEIGQSQQATPSLTHNEQPIVGYIEDILREVRDSVSSCLVIKGVTVTIPDERETQVVSFGSDVRNVLNEIILGGISELSSQNNLTKDINITVSKIEKDEKAEVRFEDNLPLIPNEKAKHINTGVSLKLDGSYGQTWGLSIVNQVARRGGGHLNVEPSAQGNVITYFIPLAKNA